MSRIPEDFTALFNAHMAFSQQRIEYWLHYTFNSWQWYFLLAMLILPWILWWKLVDKKRLMPIVAMGLMVMTTANWMDQVGSEFGWWSYAYATIPVFPQMIPVNYAMMPVGYMLLYQYFTPWRSYLVASALTSVFMTWIAEPVISWMGIYQVVSWHYSYSFPVYLGIAYTHKRIVDAIITVSDPHKQNENRD